MGEWGTRRWDARATTKFWQCDSDCLGACGLPRRGNVEQKQGTGGEEESCRTSFVGTFWGVLRMCLAVPLTLLCSTHTMRWFNRDLQPPKFKNKLRLRDYQMDGLRWLALCWCKRCAAVAVVKGCVCSRHLLCWQIWAYNHQLTVTRCRYPSTAGGCRGCLTGTPPHVVIWQCSVAVFISASFKVTEEGRSPMPFF